MELVLILVGVVGLGAVARSCRRARVGPVSDATLRYYTQGARQTRRQAFVDWSRLPGRSGNFPQKGIEQERKRTDT